jgi:hypothetical protein
VARRGGHRSSGARTVRALAQVDLRKRSVDLHHPRRRLLLRPHALGHCVLFGARAVWAVLRNGFALRTPAGVFVASSMADVVAAAKRLSNAAPDTKVSAPSVFGLANIPDQLRRFREHAPFIVNEAVQAAAHKDRGFSLVQKPLLALPLLPIRTVGTPDRALPASKTVAQETPSVSPPQTRM